VVDEALHYFIERSRLRIILLNGLTSNGVDGLKKLRPTPDAYAIIADTLSTERLFKKVKKISGLIRRRGLKSSMVSSLNLAPRWRINSFAGEMDFNVHRQQRRSGCEW
jgi:hypothetical protein